MVSMRVVSGNRPDRPVRSQSSDILHEAGPLCLPPKVIDPQKAATLQVSFPDLYAQAFDNRCQPMSLMKMNG